MMMNLLSGEKRWDWARSKRVSRPMETCLVYKHRSEAQVIHTQHRSKPKISGLPPSTANVGVSQRSVQVHWEHKCGLLVYLEGFAKVQVRPVGQFCRVAMD